MKVGIYWNLVSFVILGISGILINLIIGRFYTPEDLGVFNQVFAFYILGAQFAALGVQYSALKYGSELKDRGQLQEMLTGAFICSSLLSIVAVSLTLFFRIEIGEILKSSAVTHGLFYVSFATGLFAINKVFIAVINGMEHMRTFSVFQALRFVLLFLFILVCSIVEADGIWLSVSFLFAETVLFVFMFFYLLATVGFSFKKEVVTWIKKHLDFGTKGFFGGAVTELNSRVDILMLGFFLTDKIVGIYSVAAIIAEGIAQLSVVIRNNINPKIALFYSSRNYQQLTTLMLKTRNYFYLVMALVSLISIILYPLAIEILMGSDSYSDSWLIFTIIVIGLFISSGYQPLDMTLIQSGFPGTHSIYRTITLFSNVALNFLFIPLYGIVGAAVATAISFALSSLYLKIVIKRKIGLVI